MAGHSSDAILRLGSDRLRLPKLTAACNQEQFDIHTAALEWSLDAPITIQGEADIQSKRAWEGNVSPYRHQITNLITFCRRAPVALLADDVGLGKTISAALILSELIARRKVARTLVVAPRMLLSQWQEELGTKFGIPAECATGQGLSSALGRNIPAVITTYESLKTRLDAIASARFDMVIFDEAHKLRNLHGTAAPPQLALAVQSMLRERFFKYVLMLTATPIQNRLWDLYSLVDLLATAKGHANPLGTKREFVDTYIADQKGLQVHQSRRDDFRRHLGSYIVRTRRTDAKLMFPTRRVETWSMKASLLDQKLLHTVTRHLTTVRLNGFTQLSIGQALMSSPEALADQLQEMSARGTIPQRLYDDVCAAVAAGGTSAKLGGLLAVVKEMSQQRSDWRLLVFTRRVATQQAIGRHLVQAGVKCGYITGGKASQNERAIQAFKRHSPDINVLISTDAGAEGLNLQSANVLVNYDLPWNPMVLEQRIGRIQRLGSQHASIQVINLVLAGSVEERVVARLLAKLQAISESIGDIEGIRVSRPAGIDDEGFEELIRDLIIASLQGADTAQQLALAEASIQEAKQVYDQERQLVDTTLGDLRDMHRTGPQVPELTPLTPSIDAQTFVLRALRADGARVRAHTDGTYRVSLAGQNEFALTFEDDVSDASTPGVFGGNAPRAYVPGKRHFERLAQTWADKCGALYVDYACIDEQAIRDQISTWLGANSRLHLVDILKIDRHVGFSGEITMRASAAVEHDRLEKLVTIPISIGPECTLPHTDLHRNHSSQDLELPSLSEDAIDDISGAIYGDPDLSKFIDFYDKRLAEELPRAAGERSEERVRQQFSHTVAADAVSAKGVRYCVYTLDAALVIDGQGPYDAGFELSPHTNGRLKVSPTQQWRTCPISALPAPPSALQSCSVSGVMVLRHRLTPSAESGRLAIREHMVTCEATGAYVLPSEVGTCAISGRRVRLSALAKSAMSGSTALATELTSCEFTGDLILASETLVSQISGLKYRADQSVTCVLSQRQGHATEFVASVAPSGWIAKDEAAQSALSGEWASRSMLYASERPPHRLGLAHEFAQCRVTGRSLLRDELVESAVSRSLVDRELVVPSARSGKLALPDELAVCEVTGRRLLPTEVARCAVSGRLTDLRELVRSALSGRLALPNEMVRCAETAALLLPDEAHVCEATNRLVTPSLLEKCSVTGRRATAHNMAACPMSSVRFIDDRVSHLRMLELTGNPSVLQTCRWSGRQLLGTMLKTCALTKLRVAPEFLNAEGELVALREILSGRPVLGSRTLRPGDVAKLGQALPGRRSIKSVTAVDAPGTDVSLLAVRVRAGPLGLGSAYVGLAAHLGHDLHLLSEPVEGRRDGATWTREHA
jgi:superfamily II DNA or RNA helicase